jgi:hypothetical protein
MYGSDYPDYDFDGCEKCGAALSIGMHFCRLSEPTPDKSKSKKRKSQPKKNDDFGWATQDPFDFKGPDVTNRDNFPEEEGARLVKKLEVIESLTKLAIGRVKDNPEEIEEILRQINFHSR